MQSWKQILHEIPFPFCTWFPLPPFQPAPPQWRAVQAWFLSLARLQPQIPGLCSGFPLGLTRSLSTKHRLLIICLKSPLRPTGRYDHPIVVKTVLCVVIVEKMFYKCVHGEKRNWGGGMFSLYQWNNLISAKNLRSGPLWGTLSLGFTLETICSVHEYWLPREIQASQSFGLTSGGIPYPSQPRLGLSF